MATRSRIGIQVNDSVVSVYHHWDGYPEGLGKYLTEKYISKDQVTDLIDGGDMSTCMTDSGVPEYFSARGESNVEPQLHDNFQDFVTASNECWGEYSYLFTEGVWKCYTQKGNEIKL